VRELTEEDPFGRPQGGYGDPLIAALLSAERQSFAAEGVEALALRYGIFYGPNTFSDLFVDLMRKRLLPIPRGGGGEMCWVHVEDAAAATVAALERGRPGQPYNIVDDEPVNWRDFTWALADTFGTPRPLELPPVALRLIAPYLAVMMTSTLRVSNARARKELGWTPSMLAYRDGIRRMMAAPREAA
jgi:nucleoside-diphosphate-sugar epimerase